ncbi:BQ5605_C023g09640 [Microbotryum silenes-dioicae]|uniref:BQ5605_C023g09640 protein n=1 Tax=Microbotryum silenes-dioicae TaxID=796604 RepID=A0A2X0MPD8_9BASI|nr:BQ5605_C023g09640 [Microbotryum silenes-dioicae]
MSPTSLSPPESSSSSSVPSKLPSSTTTTTSLSSIVSNLFQRTSLNLTTSSTDPYSDKMIASLLLAEASRPSTNTSSRLLGMRGELEKEAIRKPNKRFLKGVLGDVEAHNRRVISAQRERERFEREGGRETVVDGRDFRSTERRSGEVEEDEEEDDDEQERRYRRSGQEKETDRDRDRLRGRDRQRVNKVRHRDRDKDGNPGDEGRHRSSRRSEHDHEQARSKRRRDDDHTNHRTSKSKQRDENRQHRYRRDHDEHQDRHRERLDRHRPREDEPSNDPASNDAGPIAHTTVGVPSKMDKYFAPDYDPLFDVSVENDLTDPTTRLIAPGAFDEWDTMLRTIKEKEERKREEKEGRRRRKERDKEERRRERRRRRGESVSSSDEGPGGEDERRQGKKIKLGKGKALMEVEYTKVGGTREWDRGKEHLS